MNSSLKIMKTVSVSSMILLAISLTACGDGSSAPTTTTTTTTTLPEVSYAINGYIQKGPFISGSSITIQELDDNLNPTGTSYQTTTSDDFGTFSLGSQIESRYVEVIATGFYFDEVAGSLSEANLTLRAISDLSTSEDVNINILTTLEQGRIEYLIANEGLTFTDARTQAETEVLSIFNITRDNISTFDQMDISQVGDSNAILLTISAVLQGDNTVAELSELISKINLDIKEDGALDNSTYIDEIRNNAIGLDLDAVRENLSSRYESLGLIVTIPNFEHFVDSDGDGVINNEDDDLVSDVPLNLSAIAGEGELIISWDSHPDAISYNIYWATSSGVSKTDYLGSVKDITTTSYTHTGLTNNTIYYYVVTADNRYQESDESIEVSARTLQIIPYGAGSSGPIDAVCGAYAVGDFDNDGNLDLATGADFTTSNHYDPGQLGILFGNGDGTFQERVDYDSGINMVSITTFDADGDGDIDIMTFSGEQMDELGEINVHLNNGSGTFGPKTSYTVSSGIIRWEMGMLAADVNNDGNKDILTYSEWAAGSEGNYTDICRISILLGNGDGTFGAALNYDIPEGITSVKAGDMDADGDMDLVTTSRDCGFYGANKVGILLNDGTGAFAPAVEYDHGYDSLYDVAIADINSDDDLDVITVSMGGIGVYLGNGDGTIQSPSYYETVYSADTIIVEDFNGDSKHDFIVAGDGIIVHFGTGDGTIPAGVLYTPFYGSTRNLQKHDINSDGEPDLVWAITGSGEPRILITFGN